MYLMIQTLHSHFNSSAFTFMRDSVSSRIRFLDLSANFITNFPSGMIKRLNYLTRLLFRRNSIQSLDRESFEGLTNLELIDLHDNRIQDIDNRAFKDLKSLKSLDLSLNVISTVGSSLEPLTNLMKLNLSDNYITTLPFTAFRSLNRLSTLDISNNTIVDIGEAFVDMPEIKVGINISVPLLMIKPVFTPSFLT